MSGFRVRVDEEKAIKAAETKGRDEHKDKEIEK